MIVRYWRMRIKRTRDSARLIQKKFETLFNQRHVPPLFGILCFVRGHHSAILEDQLQRQGVLLEVTHAQRGRDRTQLPGHGSHYLTKEIIQFAHRGQRVETSAKCFVRSPQLDRTLLCEHFAFVCYSRLHFLGALRVGDVGRDATNRVWLPGAVAQKKFRRDVHPFAPIRGHGFLELDRHASFDYLPVIVTNRFGNLTGVNIEVGLAVDLVASNTVATLKFAVNQKVTKVKILDENHSRSVVDDVLQSLLALTQLLLRPLALGDVYDDGREKRRRASSRRDQGTADIRPDHIAVFAPVTFLDSIVSSLPFDGLC